MTQIYNDNTRRPKPAENQLGIVGISSWEFTHFTGNSVEGAAGTTYVFENMPKKLLHLSPKSCRNFT